MNEKPSVDLERIFLGNRIETDYAIFFMAKPCDDSIVFVESVFSKYYGVAQERDISTLERVVVSKELVSKYEAVCGLGATLASCPEAESVF